MLNVDESSGTPTLNASYNDIVTAIEAGKIIFISAYNDNIGGTLLYLCHWADQGTLYEVGFYNAGPGMTSYFTSGANDELLTLEPEQQGS